MSASEHNTVFISLLRGINVGGNNKLKMAELRESYVSLGFQNVQSYIQSGNLVFEAGKDADVRSVETVIEKQITAKFGFTVPVMAMTETELRHVLGVCTFNPEQMEKSVIVFLSGDDIRGWAESARNHLVGDEEMVTSDGVAYLYCPNGLGRSKAANTLLSQPPKGIKATMRNLRTLNTLLEMTSALQTQN